MSDADANPRAVIGGNQPPEPWALIVDSLTQKTLELRKQVDGLLVDCVVPINPADPNSALVSIREFWEQNRQTIVDDATSAKGTQLCKDLGDLYKAINQIVETERKPLAETIKMIDWVKGIWLKQIEDFGGYVRSRVDNYARDKRDRERAQAAALRDREERLRAGGAPEEIAQADLLAEQRERAPDTTQIRGTHGALVSASTKWKFRRVDDAKIRRELCEPLDKLIRARMNELEKAGTLALGLKALPHGSPPELADLEPGIVFYEDIQTRIT